MLWPCYMGVTTMTIKDFITKIKDIPEDTEINIVLQRKLDDAWFDFDLEVITIENNSIIHLHKTNMTMG